MLAPVFFLFCPHLSAQDNFTVRNFDEANGLSSNFTEALAQSRTGHLIIANKGGIDRFDGKTFEAIKAVGDTNSLGYITSIHTSEDEIWFGKFNGDIGVLRDDITVTGLEWQGKIKHIYKGQNGDLGIFQIRHGLLGQR